MAVASCNFKLRNPSWQLAGFLDRTPLGAHDGAVTAFKKDLHERAGIKKYVNL